MKYVFEQLKKVETIVIRVSGVGVTVENGEAELDPKNEAHMEIARAYNGKPRPATRSTKKAGK